MAVLDAFAYGLPVITTPVGGIPDVAKNGENMLIFSPGDVFALSEELSLLIDDQTLRYTLSKASYGLSQSTFNVTNICHEIDLKYKDLINK